MRTILLLVTAILLTACQAKEEPVVETASAPVTKSVEMDRLDQVLASQPDEVKARYQYRHPKETLEFFGIEPGMTVIEGLPGAGWYSKILTRYLGPKGHLIGANYSLDMFPLFSFANEEFMARQRSWADNFPVDAEAWGEARVSAFYFGSMPGHFVESVDVVFLPRALHNLARFQNAGEGDFLDVALGDAFAALKPGGILGVVQHHARDEMSDEFASGAAGYLKKSTVIAAAEAAGFEFVAESDINANPADQPTEEEVVWRLPPSYSGAGDDEEARARVDAIGESNRMTLKFRKPE